MYVIPIYFFNVMVRKVIENISKFFEKKLEVLNSSLRKKKKAVYAYVLQVVDQFLVFFEKQGFGIEANAVAESIINKYSKLKFSFGSSVGKVIKALIIAFAKLVKTILWILGGLYFGLLLKTQTDVCERITDVLKYLFPWIW